MKDEQENIGRYFLVLSYPKIQSQNNFKRRKEEISQYAEG